MAGLANKDLQVKVLKLASSSPPAPAKPPGARLTQGPRYGEGLQPRAFALLEGTKISKHSGKQRCCLGAYNRADRQAGATEGHLFKIMQASVAALGIEPRAPNSSPCFFHNG